MLRLKKMIDHVDQHNLKLKLFCPGCKDPTITYNIVSNIIYTSTYCDICQDIMDLSPEKRITCPCSVYKKHTMTKTKEVLKQYFDPQRGE